MGREIEQRTCGTTAKKQQTQLRKPQLGSWFQPLGGLTL